MAQKISKKKIEQRKILILKCLIVLIGLVLLIEIGFAIQAEFIDRNNIEKYDRYGWILSIISCILIFIYFAIGHSIKNLKKKLK